MRLLESASGRFLLVGSTTVLIDLSSYSVLLWMLFPSALSKGVSFLCGTIFAYFANRNFTFNSDRRGMFNFIAFFMLYITTLLINVTVNEAVLNAYGRSELEIVFAFMIATFLSAFSNFMGMKYIVFAVKEKV